MGIHARSRHRELNTLTGLVMSLQGWRTTVELHSDSFVSGLVVEVDAKMNMEFADARYTDGNGKTTRLEIFHVRGRKIRYVHIPDQIDIMQVLQDGVKLTPRKTMISKKSHIAMKRTEQTLRRYRRQQQQEQDQQQQQ